MKGDEVTQRLRELAARHADGTLSDDDYAQQKQDLLGRPGSASLAEVTQKMPAFQSIDYGHAEQPTRPGRSMLLLVVAVGVVVVVLIGVVWLFGTGQR